VSSISISLALRPLRLKRGTTARCSIWHLVAGIVAKNEKPHNGAPYRSIRADFQLLDSLFRKGHRDGSIFFRSSTREKQQARLRTYRPPDDLKVNSRSLPSESSILIKRKN
jgi:hypothetical protein